LPFEQIIKSDQYVTIFQLANLLVFMPHRIVDSICLPLFLVIATKLFELLILLIKKISMQLFKQKEKQLDSGETKRDVLHQKKKKLELVY